MVHRDSSVRRLTRIALILEHTRTLTIARRYFVVNGFDGALTMLGMIVGFYHSNANPPDSATLSVIVGACLGAAIALGFSGLSSAYISESAEQRAELQALEAAMVTDLGGSSHGLAARWGPWLVALVNGLAPLLISLVILLPLLLPTAFRVVCENVLEASMLLGFSTIFLLGVFLGRISGRFWLMSGLRTTGIAIITSGVIILCTPN
jgi:predicted membrane protein (TIGR00267 family)